MKTKINNKRYIYDPLYGVIYLPNFIWEVISCPELQRLREVRLCNINSFCLIGGANINRYEHAIGTCYLAQECLNSHHHLNQISEKEYRHFMLAALFHDVASAAFGHSVEYIESKEGFDHEKAFEYVVIGKKGESYQYKGATLEPIFFGMLKEISSKVSEEDLNTISKIIYGKGRFGPLIKATLDLDNIDNVFRLAYHIGLIKSGEIPLNLAKSLWVENGKQTVRKETVPLIEEWCKVRKNLYLLLLLNPEEFSGKCMLNDAIELAKTKDVHPFNWHDVDYELLEKLSKKSAETSIIISRLMKGNLYGCIGIFSSTKTDKYKIFIDTVKKRELESIISKKIRSLIMTKQLRLFDKPSRHRPSSIFRSAMIAFHPIIDVNKTERQVRFQTEEGEIVQIGNSSNQLLIGAFFRNLDLDMYNIVNIPTASINKIRKEIHTFLSNNLGDRNIKEIKLYDEINKI